MTNQDFYPDKLCYRSLPVGFNTGDTTGNVKLWTSLNPEYLTEGIVRLEMEKQSGTHGVIVSAQLSREDVQQLIDALTFVLETAGLPDFDYLKDKEGDFWVRKAGDELYYSCGNTLEEAQKVADRNFGGISLSEMQRLYSPIIPYKITKETKIVESVEEVHTALEPLA